MSSLSVVILNWNGIAHLRRFLGSVVECTPPEADIVVADNGSTDDSVEWVERTYPTVRIVRLDRNYGFAEGYDRALRQIGSRYYILLNSDVEVTPGWTEPLLRMLETDDSIGAVAPKLLSAEQRDRFEYAGASGGYSGLSVLPRADAVIHRARLRPVRRPSRGVLGKRRRNGLPRRAVS